MDEKRQDRIDRYILGRMPEEEKALFEKDLAEDNALQEQYNFTRIVKDTVCEEARLDELMNLWDTQIEEERQHKRLAFNECSAPPSGEHRVYASHKSSDNGTWYWAAGIAAVFIVGLIATTQFGHDSKPVEQDEDTYANVGNAARKTTTKISEIEKLIANEESEEALEKIMLAEAENNSQDIASFGQEESDIDAQYSTTEHGRNADELEWLKAQALIGMGCEKEAQEVLDKLRRKDGEYKAKADSLYKVLADLTRTEE